MIELVNLRKTFDDEELLNIPFFAFENDISYLIFGPSGCGKTTFLNLIAGVLPLPER